MRQIRAMPRGAAAAAIAAAVAMTCHASEVAFPYQAVVNSHDVYVRSGPGKNYYPTDKLRPGDVVEVYRHDPGGWYAIRPPRGSFSWVSARHVRPSDDGLGVATTDRVVCRVGTRFSEVRDVIQVRLDRDEEVEILDEVRLMENGRPEPWYKIAPPSGEFRWVFGKFLDRLDENGRAIGPDPRLADDPSDDHGGLAPSARIGRTARSIGQDPGGSSGDVRLTSTSTGAQRGAEPPAAEPSTDARATAARASVADSASRGQAAVRGVEHEDPLQAELNDIDLALSLMVSEEPSVWAFDTLRRRLDTAMARAETALERGKVRLILNRLNRFEEIKTRYDSAQRMQLATDRATEALGAARTGAASAARLDPNMGFDGQGKLTPVVSQRPDAPRYALVDPNNQVLSFVSPAPGVNLQPYVGRQVGVTGQRGFVPELHKPHVTAVRVTALEPVTRR